MLAKLLSTKSANTIQAERKGKTIFLAQADVETGKLGSHRTTVPTVSYRCSRSDQRAITSSRAFLEVEEERSAAKETFVAVADERRWSPLRATQSARFKTTRVGKFLEAPSQFNAAGVVKALKDLQQSFVEAKS